MKAFLSKMTTLVLLTAMLAALLFQSGICQTCAEPLQVCGGNEHKKCCSPREGKNYVCKGTDGVKIDAEKSEDMGTCEEEE